MTRLPLLPSTTVEFNVLHDALIAGDDPVVAAAKAIAAGRGETLPSDPPLKSKSKSELLKIARSESIDVSSDATVAEIIAAIEAGREQRLTEQTGVEAVPETPAPDSTDGDGGQ